MQVQKCKASWSEIFFAVSQLGARGAGLNVIEEKQDGWPVGGGPQSNSSCYVSAASAGCSVYSLFMVVEFAVLKFQWGSIQRRLYQAEWFKCTQGAGDSHRCFLHVAGTVCSGRGGVLYQVRLIFKPLHWPLWECCPWRLGVIIHLKLWSIMSFMNVSS